MSKAIFILAIINSVFCLGLFLFSGLIVAGNVISGANMPPNYATIVITLGFIFPLIPIISVIGTWLAYYKFKSPYYVKLFMGLPWVWCVIFFASMILIFERISPGSIEFLR